MRKLGFIFIAISVGIGFISSIYPYSRCFYYGIGLAIAVFVSGIWAFMLHNAPEEIGLPKYENPPAPPKKCICNDIGKHTPGGRCEAEHSEIKERGITITRPEFPKDRKKWIY